jgi:hypothetical protein
LEQYLVTAPAGIAPADELARIQRFRELLREEVGHLWLPGGCG